MKKILTLLLFVVATASLCFFGCGGSDKPGPDEPEIKVAENAVCVNDDITVDTPLPKTATYRITLEESVTDNAGVTEDNVLMINVTEIDPRTDYVSIPYWGESCYDKDYYIEKGYTHLNYRVYIENSENIDVINVYYEDSNWAVIGETPSLITKDTVHDGWNDVSGWIDGFIDNYDSAQTHWMFALGYTGPFKIGFDNISAFKQENVGPTDVWAFQEADARDMSTEDVTVSYKETFESQNDVMHFDFNKAGSFDLSTTRWRTAHPGTYFTKNNYKSATINVYVSDASKVTALRFSESYSGLSYDLYALADGLVDGWNEIVLDGTLGLFADYNRFNRFGSLSFTTTDAVVVAIGDTTVSKDAVTPDDPGDPDDPDDPVDPTPVTDELVYAFTADLLEGLEDDTDIEYKFRNTLTDSNDVSEHNVLCIKHKTSGGTKYIGIAGLTAAHDKQHYIDQGYTHLKFRIYVSDPSKVGRVTFYTYNEAWAPTGENGGLLFNDGDKSNVKAGWNDVYSPIDLYLDNFDFFQLSNLFALLNTDVCEIGIASVTAVDLGYEDNVIWAFNEDSAEGMNSVKYTTSYESTYQGKNDVLVMNVSWGADGGYDIQPFAWRPVYSAKHYQDLGYTHIRVSLYVPEGVTVTKFVFNQKLVSWQDQSETLDGLTLTEGWHDIDLSIDNFLNDYTRFQCFPQFTIYCQEGAANGLAFGTITAVIPPEEPAPAGDESVYAFTASTVEGLDGGENFTYEFKETLTDDNGVSESNVLYIKHNASGTHYATIAGLTAAHDKQHYIDQGYTHLKFRIYVSDPSKVGRVTFYTSNGSGVATGENGGLLYNNGDKSNVKAGWNDVYSPIDLYLDNFDFFQLANQFAFNGTDICDIGIASVTAVDLGYEDNVIWAFNEDSAEGMNSVKYTTSYESTYQGKNDVLVMNVSWGADGGYDIQPFAWRPVYSAKHYQDLGYTHIRVSLYVPEGVTVTKFVFNQKLVSWQDQSETLDGLTLTEGWHDIDLSIDNFVNSYTRFQCFPQFTIYCQEGAANGLAFGTITAVTK